MAISRPNDPLVVEGVNFTVIFFCERSLTKKIYHENHLKKTYTTGNENAIAVVDE